MRDVMKKRIVLTVVLLLLDIFWTVTFRYTDSFFSIYLICSITAGLAIVDAALHVKQISSREKWIYSIASFFFSTCVNAANYHLFSPLDVIHVLSFVLSYIGGFCNAFYILLAIERYTDNFRGAHRQVVTMAEGKRRAFLFPFLGAIIVNFTFLWFSAYPGVLSTDSISQIRQIMTGEYTNHHPFWHTMLIKVFISVGTSVFHDITAGVFLYSLFQIFFMAYIFAFMIKTLYEASVPAWVLIFVVLLTILSPYHISYSATMWKDVVFGGAVTVFLTALFRLLKEMGNQRVNVALIIVSGFGFCLWRSNGLFAFVLTFIVYWIALRKTKKNLLICMAAVMIASFIMKHPILAMLKVKQPDIAEVCSIPEQQIARVIVENGELTSEETLLLSKAVDINSVKEEYLPWISDPVKNIVRNNGIEYLTEHRLDYLKLWFGLGFRFPKQYIAAWIDETRGYWNSGYSYWISVNYIDNNEFGLKRMPHCKIIDNLIGGGFTKFYDSHITEPFKAIGFTVWLTIVTFIIGIVRKERCWLLAVPGIAIIISLLISTPVYSEFRYAYALFTGLPITLLSLIVNFD